MLRNIIVLAFALTSAACATSFYGDSHFPGGPRGCSAKCADDGMDMASFIYSGEFATSCVCKPRGDGRGQARTEGDTSAVVGVIVQAQRAAQAQANSGAAPASP